MRGAWLAASVVVGFVGGWLAFDLAEPTAARGNAVLPPPAKTGAGTEQTCGQCHNLGVNDGTGLASLGAPASYVPGDTYPITVLVGRTGNTRWGFEFTALKQDGTMAGSFANIFDETAIQSSGGIDYISHTIATLDGTHLGVVNGTGWTFQWTAPPLGTGTVTFYAAAVAANYDNAATGDYTFTTTQACTEGGTTDVTNTTWGHIKQIYR